MFNKFHYKKKIVLSFHFLIKSTIYQFLKETKTEGLNETERKQ